MVDARDYHERAKHSPRSVREDSFRMDRTNQPRPYKVYENLPRHSPSSESRSPETPALTAVATADADGSGPDTGDPSIHALCRHATGTTKELAVHGRQMQFRAAACTGKLYHVDLYAVCGNCGEFDPGVYHYDPHEDAFDVLRKGDYRGVLANAASEGSSGRSSDGVLAAASGDHPGVATAPVTVVATSTWWRNAWKYRQRTYRHAFWDSGTILANLLGVAHGGGHRAEVVLGFDDDPVAELLGIDPEDEAPLELIPVGSGAAVREAPAVETIDPAEKSLSRDPKEYPILHDAWRQSTLDDGAVATNWRETVRDADGLGTHGPGDGETIEIHPVDEETQSDRPLGETIERRGSLREYSHEPISDRKFATVLDRALRGAPTDCSGDVEAGARAPGRLIDCYCLVHAVDGIDQGAYQYHPEENVLERLGDTDRETAGRLALGQGVVGDAAVNVYLMADVDAIVDAVGNRGYRLAQLEGGISLGRLYLATYAHLALGGRGFTFFDDEVTQHLLPRSGDQTPMTLFAFGKPEG